MNSYKKVFCSFGDSRLKRSLTRIENQAKNISVYDEIYIMSEKDLDGHFREKYQPHLKSGIRGFGYWCWKPQIILQILNLLDDGDILQFSDAGCHINSEGKTRLLKYFEIVKESRSGILLFRQNNTEIVQGKVHNYEIFDYQYTKGDLFKYFNVLSDGEITHTHQFAGGVIFIRKDNVTLNFINQWIKVYSDDFGLINDTPSETPSFEGFIAHRHDQSILSILAKINGVEELSAGEFYTENNWSTLRDYPIWTKRDKDFGMVHKLKRAIYIVYNFLAKS